MNLRLAALLASLAAVSVAMAQGMERFDFRGIPFGVSQKEFVQLFPMAGWCRPQRDKRMADITCGAVRDNIMCSDPNMLRFRPKCAEDRDKAYIYAGAPMHGFMAHFYNDALAQMNVTFYSADFDSVFDAVVGRYGKPDQLTSESVPMPGNTVASWRRGDSTLMLRKYSGEKTGMALYVLDSARAEFEKRRRAVSRDDL